MIGASLELVEKTVRMGKRGNTATRVSKAPRAVREVMDFPVFKGCEGSRVSRVRWEGKGKKETED